MNFADSQLHASIQALSELSGDFYFYEPRREMIRGGALSSPCEWRQPCPNEADSLSFGELSTYSLELCRELGSSLSKVSPEEAAELLCQRRLWRRCALVWISSHCQGGDYGGGTHNVSNARVLIDQFFSPELREITGGWGSLGVAVDPRYLSEDLLNSLQGLEDYPVLDEEDLSHYELELQGEAWENWAEQEFRQALESRLSEISSEDEAETAAEQISSETLYELFHQALEIGNLYWSHECATSAWIDCEDVASEISDESLRELLPVGSVIQTPLSL
jgi:hypothetical protein